MLTSIQGIYRHGKIHLSELPRNVTDETPVVVTFLKSGSIDVQERGISAEQASEWQLLQKNGMPRKWIFMTTMTQPRQIYKRGD